jgi:hypothetical protein
MRMLNANVRTILVSAYEVKEEEVFQKYVKEEIIDLIFVLIYCKVVIVVLLCISERIFSQRERSDNNYQSV